jgi:hypothetical protein
MSETVYIYLEFRNLNEKKLTLKADEAVWNSPFDPDPRLKVVDIMKRRGWIMNGQVKKPTGPVFNALIGTQPDLGTLSKI